jgi:uncharacterized protein (TIGR02680 family)
MSRAPDALPHPTGVRWTFLRGGIQNVWEYDDRRFVFERGRLLLRGQNEAGKTKAMELLFPFLLDADLAPQRLDPFGSTARPMRWNLLNEADPEQQNRTGYVWLELGRRVDGCPLEFLTLGCGLRARRGSPDVDPWFFTTSLRVDESLRLVVDGTPLTRAQLAEALGPAGQVFERGSDYRRAVNARLFGIADEQYAALVETLLQLRRPQLSKMLDLEQLSRFLSASLPPLDRTVIGPIAEGFERLDHHRSDLESREGLLESLRGFEAVHRAHARAVARGRAVELTRAESAYHAARAEARDKAAARDEAEARCAELESRLRKLGEQRRELDERRRALEGSDAYRAVQELDRAEAEAATALERERLAARRHGEDEEAARRARDEAANTASEADRLSRSFELARSFGHERARDAALAAAHGAVDALATKGGVAEATGALRAARETREHVLARLRKLAAAHRDAVAVARQADGRARELAAILEDSRERVCQAEAARDEAEAAWLRDTATWAAALEVLSREALPDPRGDDGAAAPDAYRAAVEAAAAPRRRQIEEERAAAVSLRDALARDAGLLRAERDALAARPHADPAPPPWRASRPIDRPGAPLYMLCDFAPGFSGVEARAGLEAALEASGLLDGWVEPDGVLLDARTFDTILRPAAVGGDRTLADVLVPTPAGGVDVERVGEVLASVALVGADEPDPGPETAAWVSPEGRWRLGPAAGAYAKNAPEWVGETSRALARARRLTELTAKIDVLDAQVGTLGHAIAALAESGDRLAREAASVPGGQPVVAARLRVDERAEAVAVARERHAEAERAATAAARAADEAASRVDRAAGEEGLATWARDPDALARLTDAWVQSAEQLVRAAADLWKARAAGDRAVKAATEAAARAERSRDDAETAASEASGAAARAKALRDAAGKDRDELLAALAAAREGLRANDAERTSAERELPGALDTRAVSRAAVEGAEVTVSAREAARQEAARAFETLARVGFLAAAALETPGAPADLSSFTATLEVARAVDGSVSEGATPEEREKAENLLVKRASELMYQLPPEVRLVPTKLNGMLAYVFATGGREWPAHAMVEDVDADVASRRDLLADEERALLERFLSGEAHDHLATRLREATALVARMNEALLPRTTAAGSQVRLAWQVDESAQEDAREAVPLFLKSGTLLSERNRDALRVFLETRLAVAREADGTRSLQDRLLDVLDYRTWHRFHVEHRTPGEHWVKLTKKMHAAGSGGKKAVMLHLPLFAAAAAFYDSAGPTAPRAIALDEAFAGIDRPTRGKLMGLLAEFDLDFIMTSYEEWGCYEELDGLSTYHLSRVPGQRGVFAEWFLWNGRERVLVDAS